MSWGIKIAVLYLSFVGMIITMVFLCMGQNVDLESKDYYAKELQFQNKIEAVKNANGLENIDHTVTQDAVILKLPVDLINENITGEIVFFRPSDAAKDLKIQMKFNAEGIQAVPKKDLVSGVYKLQLSWTMNGKNYFKEEIINIKK